MSVDDLEPIELEGFSDFDGDFESLGLCTPNDDIDSVLCSSIRRSRPGRGKTFGGRVVPWRESQINTYRLDNALSC